MAIGRPLFGLLALFFIAGALLLEFFVLLAGAVGPNTSPIDSIFFLEANTTGIPGAPNGFTRWTFWNVAPTTDLTTSGLDTIPYVTPAYPFDPKSNFGGNLEGMPLPFLNTSYFYYATRFMFAFNLIALFFMVCALFLSLLALCSRIGSYLSSVMTFVALFFQIIMAALMTAAYVKGRDAFRGNTMDAYIGSYAFGFIWATVALLFLASVLFCIGGASSRSEGTYTTGGRMSRFRRNKSTRSRGSFIDSESQRPVVREV